jgi:Fe-Mn family superoxide dismutase
MLATLVSPLAAHAFRFDDGVTAVEFKQDELPYEYGALEPYIDAKTMELHYSKHHAAYVKNVNEALSAEKANIKDEKDLFKKIASMSDKIRNNGGGAWNHNFFWKVMKPNGGAPSGKISDAINASFGSLEKFKDQFKEAALGQFGSGWAWLVSDNGKLAIGSTPNQDNPLMQGAKTKGTPILGLDVWEHAYYLKYQNKRAEYVDNWWNVVNWDEAAKNLG